MAPLKAIDFGLAVPFDPDKLPKEDLGLEGTPWYVFYYAEINLSSLLATSDVPDSGHENLYAATRDTHLEAYCIRWDLPRCDNSTSTN